jgi:ketosteroid isomerase-like protein
MNPTELETRIKALENIKAIKSMSKEFVFRLMNSQIEGMIECFTDNAVVEMRSSGTSRGKEEIAEIFKREMAELNNSMSIYMLVQPVITANGDTAKGHWIMDYFSQNSDTPSQASPTYTPGRYDCEYLCIQGEWKFSYLKWTCPWP